MSCPTSCRQTVCRRKHSRPVETGNLIYTDCRQVEFTWSTNVKNPLHKTRNSKHSTAGVKYNALRRSELTSDLLSSAGRSLTSDSLLVSRLVRLGDCLVLRNHSDLWKKKKPFYFSTAMTWQRYLHAAASSCRGVDGRVCWQHFLSDCASDAMLNSWRMNRNRLLESENHAAFIVTCIQLLGTCTYM